MNSFFQLLLRPCRVFRVKGLKCRHSSLPLIVHRLVDGLDLKKAMRIERSPDLLDHSWNGEGGIRTLDKRCRL